MGDSMTFATFGETLMHRFGMRQAMTVTALRHSLMLVRMTSSTGNRAVFGLTLGECC